MLQRILSVNCVDESKARNTLCSRRGRATKATTLRGRQASRFSRQAGRFGG